MTRKLRTLALGVTTLGFVLAGGSAWTAPKEKAPQDKPEHAKGHKDKSGKNLLGDKVKHDGHHKLEDHGKFAASVDVSGGKVKGVNVKHADKGDVPVTKYKTNKQMAAGATSGIMLASLHLAQDAYLGTTWIGYSFIDDYGYEIIYWFPYDMILDGDTGAIEYYPAY